MIMKPTRPHLAALLFASAIALLPSIIHAASKEETLAAPWPKDSYYKTYPMFHQYPDETGKKAWAVYRLGPVGIGIDLTVPAFGMKVKNVEEGSPAEATGKLKVGQIIESINGKVLKDIDPRVLLGNLITQAEASDGKVLIKVKDTPTAPAQDVLVQIPVLGAYSKTWPLKCAKSDKIVRGVADYLAANGNPEGALGHDQALLFLLSTGEEKDLEVARRWVGQMVTKTKNKPMDTTIPWAIGYGAPGLCEYYLRTGDATVLPLIQKIADQAARVMYNGGWNHRTAVNFKYGHMNAAGVHCVKFLLLAKECGVNVDEYTLQTSLRHFFRYAGRGNVPYGDSLPEGGFVDNGKVGGLAFAMAAAASLTPDGEKSVYAQARDVCAAKSFYSTSWMLHGHTGGGIGEIWRSSAMALLYESKPTKFREFMDNRIWHLDLSRRYNGAMTVLRDTDYSRGYDNEMWGSGYAMTYTVPRKTLRMTGAPPSKYSKKYQLPKRPWGTAADDAFYSLAPAPGPGKPVDVDSEKLVSDASYPLLRKLHQPDISDATLLQYAGHPDHGVRMMAAQRIRGLARDGLILQLLKDKEPRVRQAGVAAICYDTFGTSSIPAERLTPEMVDCLAKMIADPNEAWWTVQNAMMALSIAKPEQIAPHVDLLLGWLKHEEWWMQRAAMTALIPIAREPQYAAKILPAVSELTAKNTVGGAISPMMKLVEALKQAKPEVQQLARDSFVQAYEKFPVKLKAPGGMDMQNAVGHLHGGLASAISSFPGGFDELYKASRKVLPGEALPYKHLYFKADFSKFGPELAKAMPTIVLEDVIPEYLGANVDAILEETRWAQAQEQSKRTQFAVGALDGMVDFYREIGINDYNWQVLGPKRDEIQWEYFSYDAGGIKIEGNPMVYIDRLKIAQGQLDKAKQSLAGLDRALKHAVQEKQKRLDSLKGQPADKLQAEADKLQKSVDAQQAKFGAAEQALATAERNVREGMLVGKLPKGMENWYATDFRPTGWKQGFAPFANTDGQLKGVEHRCKGNFCGCGEPPKTLWEKEVLLMRATVELPPLQPDHRYRFLLGGNIHSKQGGPVLVYINGVPVHQQGGFGGRLRGMPRGFFIDKQLAEQFKSGKVQVAVAAIRPPKAYLSAWFEQMKMPPVTDADLAKALTRVPMTCSEWQELQDPETKAEDPGEGKFRYDGKFIDDPALHGDWKAVDQVDTVADFTGTPSGKSLKAPFASLSIKPQGKTHDSNLIWSGKMLMLLQKKEALAMQVVTVAGKPTLFVEAGGFSDKNPKGWQSPLLVFEKVN